MSELPVPASRPIDRQRAKHSLDSLDAFIDQAEADAKRLAERGDVWGLGDGLERLRAIKRKLSDLERVVEDLTVPLMPSKVFVEDGLGMERKQSYTRRNWQSEDLLSALWGIALVDENGEADPDHQPDRFVGLLREAARFEWRVTPLRDFGLEPSEWCEEGPGRVTVRVWRGENDG